MRPTPCQPLMQDLLRRLSGAFANRAVVCCAMLLLSRIALPTTLAAEADSTVEFFEREVRPLIIEHCQGCHGGKKQESDLRLDSQTALKTGGVSGPAVVPGEPDQSLIVKAVRYQGDLKMPPKQPLNDRQVAILEEWVRRGAYWPEEMPVTNNRAERAAKHWAFQPLQVDPALTQKVAAQKVASSVNSHPSQNEVARVIDYYIDEKLRIANLVPTAQADRRTLIRRASLDLTGLLPSDAQVQSFVNDPSPEAYAQLIEQLLSSPHYGEQWARHWLDLARYSDTKGYRYAREQNMWVHAWVYRDWVVRALNEDLPYDRFLLLQLAADQVAPDDPAAQAAMGFLTIGRRFLGVARDIIDDRIDVVTRGTMGMTVACARCHDHKYDPIPTQDYYSLYGVFQNCTEQQTPADRASFEDGDATDRLEKIRKARQEFKERLAQRREETLARVRARTPDYLAAQLELSKYPVEGFDQIFSKEDLLPTFVWRWQAWLASDAGKNHRALQAWHRFMALPDENFAEQADAVRQHFVALAKDETQAKHPEELDQAIAALFDTPVSSKAEVVQRYGRLFAESPVPAIRQILEDPQGPCVIPDEPIANIEYHFDSGTCDELWKLQNAIDRELLQADALPVATVLRDRAVTSEARVFRRGNPTLPGDSVSRHFLSCLSQVSDGTFKTGSGRLELAQAIVDPRNPLTARVLVNRLWQHHFGAGLVKTPSDFGLRAEPPSHPELLDYLADRFIRDGWSIKQMHRAMMLSNAYQRASAGLADDSRHREIDPDNRLLWRMTPRRLTWEELRDAMLNVAGELRLELGGRSADMFTPNHQRRSLYGLIDRQFVPTTLRVFDFANPDLHVPARAETIVPQQALFAMNSSLVLHYVRRLAKKVETIDDRDERINALFRELYQRLPTDGERQAMIAFIDSSNAEPVAEPAESTKAWSYGYAKLNIEPASIGDFQPLPHFTGSAWQGSASYPDAKLGWAQCTATGGHPGNNLEHAAVRRWTAPADLKVMIATTLVHEPQEGDGLRGSIMFKGNQLLSQAVVHHDRKVLKVDDLQVAQGDTLDFVADIGGTLAYDQFLWDIRIEVAGQPDRFWHASDDFVGPPVESLSPWEQLVQVLMSANEFAYID